ncbi:aminoglycoside phosphotransferase family protein [Priestia taiwanensis]|uniref:Streptomycin 6-kinase n=1 Tax=Priestia taiwanensis TaxID=1347902 RepID=A0A917AJW7_9BACI|nr:aminoglycoside phosphotransferase family protein [Priestia taiwanensis]MBM7361840.1 streptomycin 6-kinase [Priestia taiwanensis]GGE57341.1 streptomycin 6-kinase [Priestia taiwanensis]
MISLSERFITHTKDVYGEQGTEWLKTFPHLLQTCQEQWKLSLQEPFPNLSYNYVQSVTTKTGEQCVLKLFINKEELSREMEALQLFDGNGMARLIDANMEAGALLLEHLSPGHALSTIESDEEATAIAASVMKQLNNAVSTQHSLPCLEGLAYEYKKLRKHFNGSTGPIPAHLVEKAELLFPALLQTIQQPVLLHGDLHHDNILCADDTWKAIDPKGLIGEVEYETVPFLYNYLLNQSSPLDVLNRRINQFVDILHLNRERILCWGLCHSIISAWWFLEDNIDEWKDRVLCAQLFDELMTNSHTL